MCPGVEKVYIVGDDYKLNDLNSLKKLTFISTTSTVEELDFVNFPQLTYCCFTWSDKINNLETCKGMLQLRIYKYKSPQNNLAKLPFFADLKIIVIVSSPITSLDGIERFSLLKNFEGYYLTKIENINALAKVVELESLILQNCKKIFDYEKLEANKQLKKLILSNCGEIKSIQFIRELRMLKSFTFMGSIVVDGDMTPCIGLDYFAFTNRKKYSHTVKEIRTLALKNKNLRSH